MRAKGCLACCLGLLAVGAQGCGGVGVERHDAEPLRVLAISPRLGEIDVPADSAIVVVFSARVVAGPDSAAGEVNPETFRVLGPGGQTVVGQRSISSLDSTAQATVVFRSDAPLAAGLHEVVLGADLRGTSAQGSTAPLGVEIHTTFEVEP
jgi:hypothetical protein